MFRIAALAALLTFTGVPVAGTACLVRCAGTCDPSSPATSRVSLGVGAISGSCLMSVDSAPATAAGTRIELAASVHALFAVLSPISEFGIATTHRGTFASPREEPPPGVSVAPLVLRI